MNYLTDITIITIFKQYARIL